MARSSARERGVGPNGRPSSRDDIRSAFTRRIAEAGYDGTNFGAIADELGISKGTIVHHFGTKERLFADAHERYLDVCLAEAKAIVGRLDGPDRQLAGVVWAFSMYQTYRRTETVAFQREVVRFGDAESMVESRRLRAEYRELVKQVLRSGVESGVFLDGDVSTWTLQIFGGTQWMWTWFDPAGPLSNDEVARSYVALILRGLLRDPARVDGILAADGTVRTVVYQVLNSAADRR